MTRILLGGDHAGFELRQALKASLVAEGHAVEDLGSFDGATSVDYPDYAEAVARRVAAGEGLGILVCGTGMGVSIAANKVPGARAARVTDEFSARMARAHNDANVLCLGAWLTPPRLASEIARAFLATAFEGGRHERRIAKLAGLEARGRR